MSVDKGLTNTPWECPRCGRMNAPFNPTCFCSPTYKSMVDNEKSIPFKPIYTFADVQKEIDKKKKQLEIEKQRCSNCNGFHGMWNGKPVECVNLQAGFNWGLAGATNV